MKSQNIAVDALGRVVSDYGDRSVVDLRKLGNQSVKRFSEVLHCDHHQMFYVIFRESAPERLRECLLSPDLYRMAKNETWPCTGLIMAPAGIADACLFDSYSEGVTAEQAVLAYLMMSGEL